MPQDYYVHNLSPIIFDLPGPFQVSWYGLMYVLGFITGYVILNHLRKTGFLRFKSEEEIGDLLTYSIFGVLIGGRLGHVIFYDPGFYFSHPLEILQVWKGGMASHGGIIGVAVATWMFSRKSKVPILNIMDALTIAAPPGLGFGRFGNFINGEMVGKITDVPWAVIFPRYDMHPRHPVQIYQALASGLVLFLVMWFFPRDKYKTGSHVAVFLFTYGILRIVTEYFREVDPENLGFFFGFMTMGQLLSVIMILLGAGFFIWLNRDKGERPAAK
jgi:phosphatidylglycerol:prolipoprotein diacylglycerol transferase